MCKKLIYSILQINNCYRNSKFKLYNLIICCNTIYNIYEHTSTSFLMLDLFNDWWAIVKDSNALSELLIIIKVC